MSGIVWPFGSQVSVRDWHVGTRGFMYIFIGHRRDEQQAAIVIIIVYNLSDFS